MTRYGPRACVGWVGVGGGGFSVQTKLNNGIEFNISRANQLHNKITRNHRRDTTMVAMLFSIVIVFLVCHSSKLILNMYEAVQVISEVLFDLTCIALHTY